MVIEEVLRVNETIKYCHFCGSDEVKFCTKNQEFYRVRCASCGASAENSITRSGAIAKWNRRQDDIAAEDEYAREAAIDMEIEQRRLG